MRTSRRSFVVLGALCALTTLAAPAALSQKGGGGSTSTSRIAFTDWAKSGGMRQIFLINPDGTGKTQLTNETTKQHDRMSWSPDGTRLAVSVATDQIKVITVANGQYLQYAHRASSTVSWSGRRNASTGALLPWDQQQFAYAAPDSNGTMASLAVRAPDGSGVPTVLVPGSLSDDGTLRTDVSAPSWLPEAAGSPVSRIAYTLNTWQLNPDGSWSALSREPRLLVLDSTAWPSLSVIRDQSMTTIGALPVGVDAPGDLTWDRQGAQVVWQRPNGGGFWLAQVGVDPNGDPAIALTTATALAVPSGMSAPYRAGNASFGPLGDRICFAGATNTYGTQNGVYQIRTDNTGLLAVYTPRQTPGVYFLAWSP